MKTMSIYELTDEERAVMKKLIDNGMVVTIGKHADVKREWEQAVFIIRRFLKSHRTNEEYDHMLDEEASLFVRRANGDS